MMFYEPISLGYTCEVKYQICRHLYFKLHPDGERSDFERQLFTPELGQRSFERHIFDWQIAPFGAVVSYLERDFQGVFERSDLEVAPDGSGEVWHRALKTRHPHDFHPVDGVLDARVIDAQYGEARAKFEYLADKFRRLLTTPGRFLYVFREIRIYDETLNLLRLLTARCAEHLPHVLYVGLPGEDQWLVGLEGSATKSWAPLASPDWRGDDAAWDRVLDQFDLRSARATSIRGAFD